MKLFTGRTKDGYDFFGYIKNDIRLNGLDEFGRDDIKIFELDKGENVSAYFDNGWQILPPEELLETVTDIIINAGK